MQKGTRGKHKGAIFGPMGLPFGIHDLKRFGDLRQSVLRKRPRLPLMTAPAFSTGEPDTATAIQTQFASGTPDP
jgi:hypothetical protein